MAVRVVGNVDVHGHAASSDALQQRLGLIHVSGVDGAGIVVTGDRQLRRWSGSDVN